MLVTVPSFSNADDADGPLEKNRAKIFECNPDGSDVKIFAYGIRNPSFMSIDPKTSNLWITVNERDGLGDNLVPDYITHVERGGFYGWPWWYMGGHQDPRLAGRHPSSKTRSLLQMCSCSPTMLPLDLLSTMAVSSRRSSQAIFLMRSRLMEIPFHRNSTSVPNGHISDKPIRPSDEKRVFEHSF